MPARCSDFLTGDNLTESAKTDKLKSGIDDPRALDILTTEHSSLLATRTIGTQEMFGRATIFVSILSATVVALAFLAQATHFGRETLSFALLMICVALFIGLVTFIRSVELNFEDARCVAGMDLLRQAYLEIVPELEKYFVSPHEPKAEREPLAHGSPQRLENLGRSLTTTSSVVAVLNSVLVGSLAGGVARLVGIPLTAALAIGAGVSLISGVLHARYAARFRRRHALP